MDDLIKGVKAALYDRLASPLLLSFGLSWLAWNYRLVVIIISALTPSDKFLAIDLLGFAWENNSLYWVCHLFVFPLGTASGYIFLFPWVDKLVFEYSLERKKDLKKSRQRIEDDMPISIDEARELRALSENAYSGYEATIRTRQEEIARLKVELNDLREQLRTPSRPLSDFDAEAVSESQANLLKQIADMGGTDLSKYHLFKSMDAIPRVRVQYDLDALERKKFIGEYVAQDEHESWDAVRMTAEGRKYLVEHVLRDVV